MALIPWHTSTTIDGTTYKGTFYFDAPAYVEIDTIEWKDQSLVPSIYEIPDSIYFNGTNFKVVICQKFLTDSTNPKSPIAYKPLYINTYRWGSPDSISFLYFQDVNMLASGLRSVYFKDSMDYISVWVQKVYNYSAPILQETVSYDTLSINDNVQILKRFNAIRKTLGDQIYYDYFGYKSRRVDFKNVHVIKSGAIYVGENDSFNSLECIEFSGSKLDSVEERAISTSHITSLKRLDLHDSPAFLKKECFSFYGAKMDYFRCGTDSFSSSAFVYDLTKDYFPFDTIVLTKARRINIVRLTDNQIIIAPKVDALVANSIVRSRCNPKKWIMGVKTIKQNAFIDNNVYPTEEEYSLIDTLHFPSLQTIEPQAFYGKGISMNCLMVTDKVESIGDSILMFGPNKVIIAEGNNKFYTEDGEWLFSKDNPEKPILHYGTPPDGESYTPQSKYGGYNVDVSHVQRVNINRDFLLNDGWRFYNRLEDTVDVYINKDKQGCLDAIKLCEGKNFEFYVPEDVYPELMTALGYPPGYPAPYHPFDYTGINSTQSDTIKISVVNGQITVTGGNGRDNIIEVYSSDGRLLYNGTVDNQPRLSPGIYIVRYAGSTAKVSM